MFFPVKEQELSQKFITDQANDNIDSIVSAIGDIMAGDKQNETAKRYGIPRGDMSRYMKGAKATLKLIATKSAGYPGDFPSHEYLSALRIPLQADAVADTDNKNSQSSPLCVKKAEDHYDAPNIILFVLLCLLALLMGAVAGIYIFHR